MSTFSKSLIAVGVLVIAGIGLVAVRYSKDRRNDASVERQKTVEVGAVSTPVPSVRHTETATASVVNPKGEAKSGGTGVASTGRLDAGSVSSGPDAISSRVAMSANAVPPVIDERARRFIAFNEEAFEQRLTELRTVGDGASHGDLESIRTLMAVGDSLTSLSGEAIRMLGLMPDKSPELMEYLVRHAQTPDYRIAVPALQVLPKIADESRAFGIVSNVLALCRDKEYGSTNKVGPVCVYVGRDRIREACIGVLASFRSAASLTIVEQELGALERTTEKVPGQQEYGTRLTALLHDMRSMRPVPAPP